MERQEQVHGQTGPRMSPLARSWALSFAPAAHLLRVSLAQAFIATALGMAAPAAHAVDGCKLLLCLAGNWKDISQCRPDVEQALWDVARGHGWPTCNDANGAVYQRATEGTCPAFYSSYNSETGVWSGCQYNAILSVRINNVPWSDMFWTIGSTSTSTRYYAPARAALGDSIDPRFDLDAADWVPPPAPVCNGGDSC